MARNPINVALGVMFDEAGRILLARRPAGKALSGYLEFPGGKVERGENPAETLARELTEEIGIVTAAADCEPLIRYEYAYPDFTVRLHAYTVFRWQGEPVGAEGQVLGWHDRASLPALPLLPANRVLLNALALPALLRVTPVLTIESFPVFANTLERVIAAGEPGGIIIRLDGAAALEQLKQRLTSVLATASQPVLLNPGEAVALPEGFSGLHLPGRALRGLKQRPPGPGLIGASVHDPGEARRAGELALDYVVVGNLRPTPSHPGRPPLGWARFEEIALAAGLPSYAIGGADPGDVSLVRSHWGQGVAGIRAFWPGMA